MINSHNETILEVVTDELYFDFDYWNIPQYVTINAVDNGVYSEDMNTKLTHTAYSKDEDYKNLPEKDMDVNIENITPEPDLPTITVETPTNEETVSWNIESGGGTGNYSCKLDSLSTSCFAATNLPEGKHILQVKEEISSGLWTEEVSFEIEKDTGMPCTLAYAPEATTAENTFITITYYYEDKYECQKYENHICGGTDNDHCPDNVDRGSGIEKIELWVQTPNSEDFALIDSDINDTVDGHFNYTATNEGVYQFFTRAIDEAGNAESQHPDSSKIAETIYTKSFSGYAIISVGSVSGQEGIKSHTLTANNIYKCLIRRKFWPEHIKYFNPYDEKQPGESDYTDDGQSYSIALKNAITQWAPEQINKLAGPLYIILIDHGSPDIFHLTGTQDLSSSKMKEYLSDLEDLADDPEIIIIQGTCFSGSFIDELSSPGRIIVASAAEDEPSFRGPKINSGGVRDGGYFITNLFNELVKGKNLQDSFNTAVVRTETFTYSSEANNKAPFNDTASQHPLLDDDGNGSGSNNILPFNGDGYNAQNIILGHDPDSEESTAFLETNTLPEKLQANENTVQIKAMIKNPENAERVWIEVRKPDTKLEQISNISETQQEIQLEEFDMEYHNDKFELECDFEKSGKYTIFFYIKDKEGIISDYQESVVYKNKADNKPPESFEPVFPPNNETELSDVILEWESTRDPEKDQISYSVVLSTNSETFIQKQIFDTTVFISLPKTWDKQDVSWKVLATDEFGNSTETETWKFTIDNNHDIWGPIAYLQVFDIDTKLPIPRATITIDSNNLILDLIVNENGLNIERFIPGDYTITASIENYYPITQTIQINPGSIQALNFNLDFKSSLGDLNRNSIIDVGDAIQCLQILSGMNELEHFIDKDALFGESVGLKDVIYVLQKVSDHL